MELINKWQRVFLFLLLFTALGVSACTTAVNEPAAPVEAIEPLESERVEIEQAPAGSSEEVVGEEAERAPGVRNNEAVGTEEGELTGTVEQIEGDLWTIEGQTFVVSDQTEVKGDFAAGDEVKVHILSQADGSLMLREVEAVGTVDDDGGEDDSVQDEPQMVEREFTGTLEAMEGDLWTINGESFVLTNQTEVKGSFAPGDQIKVHALTQADGTLLLREVEPAETDDDDDDSRDEVEREEQELTGTLEAMNGDRWTVNGQTFIVTEQTEIEGNLAAGDQVKIHFFNGADGSLMLREVELADGGSDMDDAADDDDDGDDVDDDSDDGIDDDMDDDDDSDETDDAEDNSSDTDDGDMDDDSNGDDDDDSDEIDHDSDDDDSDDTSDDDSDDDGGDDGGDDGDHDDDGDDD